MTFLRRGIPTIITILFGLITLIGLLAVPAAGDLLLGWATFLAAVALVLGIFNLLAIHLRRTAGGSGYSLLLVLSMVAVFALAVTDMLGVTENGIDIIFFQVQAPLEAALASLLAFFLLFAGVRLLRQQRNLWSVLFLVAALFFLVSQSAWPAAVTDLLSPVRRIIDVVLVTAGMRGLLLGIALGAITLSVRLLAGLERPYSS